MSAWRDRSQFYLSLATMLEAGVPLLRVMQQRYPGRFQRAARGLGARLEAGATLAEAMRADAVFSGFERNVTAAGELTGCLPAVFRSLGEWYALKHLLRGRIISGLAYPLMMYHLAGPLLCVVDFFTGKLTEQEMGLAAVAWRLVWWTALPWALYAVLRLLGPMLRRSLVCGYVFSSLPGLGILLFRLEGASFFKSLSLCLGAGVGAQQSVRLAAESCVNQVFRRRYRRMADVIQAESVGFVEAFHRHLTSREAASAIPALMATGEEAGHLDEYADRIARMLSDEAAQQLEMIANLLPKAMYFALMGYIGYKIISFYAGYFSRISELL